MSRTRLLKRVEDLEAEVESRGCPSCESLPSDEVFLVSSDGWRAPSAWSAVGGSCPDCGRAPTQLEVPVGFVFRAPRV